MLKYQDPRELLVEDIIEAHEGVMLKCPVCGDIYNHAVEPTTKTPEPHDDLDCIPTVIPMQCEGHQHRWELGVGFRKGNSYLFIRYDDHKEAIDAVDR
jgi:hypothetical protein